VHKSRAPGCPADYIPYSGTQHLQHNYDSLSVTLYTKKRISNHALSRVPGSTQVHRSLPNCGSSVGNLPHITFLVLLDFWKICGPLYNINFRLNARNGNVCLKMTMYNQNMQ